MTHHIHNKGHIEPTVNFTEDIVCKCHKDHFLANKANRQRMIMINVGAKLEANGYKIVHSGGDAEQMIVQMALQPTQKQDTIVVEDTDLLILLCHHASLESHKIVFRSEPKQTARRQMKIWDIQALKRCLGFEVCNYIIFVHAFIWPLLYGIITKWPKITYILP